MKDLIDQICFAARSVVPAAAALHEPEFTGREEDYTSDCVRSGWVSSVGSYVDRIEDDLCTLTGNPFAIATASGTAALQLAYRAVGVGAGDEVIVPSTTFVATAAAASHLGAIPHFVDCEPQSFGIDAKMLQAHIEQTCKKTDTSWVNATTGRRIAAIVVTHVFGHIGDIEEIAALAKRLDIPMIEDAAGAVGSTYHGRHAGTFADVGILSFNGNKIVTTGGGGAVLTANQELAKRMRHLSTTAKAPHKWEYKHDAIGYNFRMPNLNAALGCGQLEQLSSKLERKRRLAALYDAAFGNIDNVRFLIERTDRQSNYWLNAIILDEHVAEHRDDILAALNDAGLSCRPLWYPLHDLPIYKSAPHARMKNAGDLYRRTINLPSSPQLVDKLQGQ